MDVHIVVKGDTLWKIARQYGIPFEELKRVNAHLANPDYVVPGMKIFLPKKKAEHMPSEKGKEKMPEKGKQHQAPPQAHEKPSKPKEKVPLPKEKFEMPKPPSVPTPPMPSMPEQKPPAMTLPAEQPMQPLPSIPPAVPMPPMQMPQFYQPIMPVPCGWMPIYDADCVPMPMPFPSYTQQIPAPSMPTQVMPSQEMPMPPAQMGVKPPEIEMTDELEEFEESPIYPGRGPGVAPPYPVRGWELMESPMMPEESPEQMVHCPPEQGYVPQMVSPEFQNPYGMMQQQPIGFGYPCHPMHHHCGCGCGCHSNGFYHMAPSGMQPNQMMPMQVSPMQMQPAQMYPTQMYPSQMYPMQMNPMHMQPYNPMDNYGCGC